jgi:hypothetical protein
VGEENIQIVHYFDHGYLEEEKSMIHSFTVTFRAKYAYQQNLWAELIITEIPIDMNSISIKLCHMTNKGHIPQKFELSK